MPRKDLSLKDKIAILDKIKNQPCNTSHRQLQEIIGVPKSTIGRLLSQQQKLREEWESRNDSNLLKKEKKRKRDGKDPDVEKALDKWFSIVTGRGVRVNGEILKTKSEELAKKLGHINFKATDGWLSRWKTRHAIKFKKAHGEKDSADTTSAEGWKNTKLPELLHKFSPDDIYNADETGLLYRATPDGSLVYKSVNLSGSKKAMDRFSVLCCVNMSGGDKRKLLVIGKSAKPRCFKGLVMNRLPVVYHANKNAWMTSVIFQEWLKSWDAELQRDSRKVLLLLDNCAAHPHLDCLRNIQLEFLPANTTSLIQPLDMGIIKNLKTLYRGKLVHYILEKIEANLLTSTATAKEISSKITILQAIYFLTDSWRAISSKTVQNCFAHCGFKSEQEVLDVTILEDENTVLELQSVKSYEDFVSIDSDLQCYDNAECEDAIVEEIASNQVNSQNDIEINEDETAEPIRVTNQEARKCIDDLRLYFMQEGNECSPTSALDTCADFVHSQSRKAIRQKTIDGFFTKN